MRIISSFPDLRRDMNFHTISIPHMGMGGGKSNSLLFMRKLAVEDEIARVELKLVFQMDKVNPRRLIKDNDGISLQVDYIRAYLRKLYIARSRIFSVSQLYLETVFRIITHFPRRVTSDEAVRTVGYPNCSLVPSRRRDWHLPMKVNPLWLDTITLITKFERGPA
jgi:hypothetical protein